MAELALTVKEAAEKTGLSISTMYWLVYRNEIPHRRVRAKGRLFHEACAKRAGNYYVRLEKRLAGKEAGLK